MPRQKLLIMAGFLLLVAGVVAALWPGLSEAFGHHPVLNGMILGVLAFGIFYNFRQVSRVQTEVAWVEEFRRGDLRATPETAPSRLTPMATLLGERRKITLNTAALRSILDSIGARLDESRDISRYLIALLIFLGLLGTFWGLLIVVSGVTGVIQSLGQVGDASALFANLQAGLRVPLGGMGTAFGTSLFGLAGSLVLGFLDLQASQAQNRFFNDLEEYLSGLTRVGSGPISSDGEQSVPAYIQALLEQTADNMESLQRLMARGEERATQANQVLNGMSDRLAQLADQLRGEQQLLMRFAEAQGDLKAVMERLADAAEGDAADDAMRVHIRNMDVQITRLLERTDAGFGLLSTDIRNEIRLLTRTIAALAEAEPKR